MQQLDLLRLSLSLALVVVLILLAAWLARRSGLIRTKSKHTQLDLIASLSVGGKNSVVVIEVENQRLVLGVSQQSVTLLHTLPAAAAPASAKKPPDFNSELNLALSQQRTEPSENNAS